MDGAQYPSVSTSTAPLFQLGRVQFALPARLISLAVASDVLAMGFANNMLVIIELWRPTEVQRIEIRRKPNEMTLHKIFLDPSGKHLILTSTQGENWYLYHGWKRPKPLKSFKMVIESVAWNKTALLSNAHSTSSYEFLIGARNGTFYEAILDAEDDFFKSQERYLQQVFSLPERLPVTGLQFEYFPASDSRKVVVFLTTDSRIYQFIGNHDRRTDDNTRIFQHLFASYKDTVPSKLINFTIKPVLMRRYQRLWSYPAIYLTPSYMSTTQALIKLSPYRIHWLG